MATKYEFSTVTKEDLVWDAKKLQEMGRDVPYVDTRKKKVAPAAKPAAPAAAASPATVTAPAPAPETPSAASVPNTESPAQSPDSEGKS